MGYTMRATTQFCFTRRIATGTGAAIIQRVKRHFNYILLSRTTVSAYTWIQVILLMYEIQ